jgi:8-oxo-dGTP diphosphatase
LLRNERGKWETPGGGSELGETMAQTLKREMKEEYGIEVEPVELLHVVDHIIKEEGQHWVAITYICRVVSGEPTIMEEGKCDAIGWFDLDQASSMPLSLIGEEDVKDLRQKYPQGLPDLY